MLPGLMNQQIGYVPDAGNCALIAGVVQDAD
jgi:hypothetical protein